MSAPSVQIGDRTVGGDAPAYVVGEIGINHNGDVDVALALIDMAAAAGCDAVKLQKRVPRDCVPRSQWDVPRETPWGLLPYIEYRERLELDREGWLRCQAHASAKGLHLFGSPWDASSVEFLEALDPPCHKVPSALLTSTRLLDRVAATGRPVLLSTGMSTLEEIDAAIARLDRSRLILLQCTSTYPCPADEVNLRVMDTYRARYPDLVIGYSGHEVGLQVSLAAVARGAAVIERHITLDRAMWGSDHAASLESEGLRRLVRDVRAIEAALGDGDKRVYPSEAKARQRLRPPSEE